MGTSMSVCLMTFTVLPWSDNKFAYYPERDVSYPFKSVREINLIKNLMCITHVCSEVGIACNI